MEEKKPDQVIDKDGKEFKAVNFTTEKKQKNYDFTKNIAMPFVSGVLGAGIVLGTCFGVPSIRENIVGKSTTNTVLDTSTSSTGSINTTQISLENYSETGIAVAQKVLP